MVTRRAMHRSVAVERPRRKGWWGAPEAEELAENDHESAGGPVREPGRRTIASHGRRPTAQIGRALTPGQVEAIRVVMRLFVDDDLARGVEPQCTLLCHRCAVPRRAAGSVRYDRFTFCNDCSTEFELQRARGLLELPGEFLERTARAASA